MFWIFTNYHYFTFSFDDFAFLGYLQDEGITDFYEAKNWVDENINDIKKNPLADPSLTKAQREGLEEFHRWLNRNCEKTGVLGDKEAGGMRDFANKFMSQPASVQLKALYLLETGKRKAPDATGLDDFGNEYKNDFKIVFTTPKDVIIGTITQFLIMPVIAYLLSIFFHLWH